MCGDPTARSHPLFECPCKWGNRCLGIHETETKSKSCRIAPSVMTFSFRIVLADRQMPQSDVALRPVRIVLLNAAQATHWGIAEGG